MKHAITVVVQEGGPYGTPLPSSVQPLFTLVFKGTAPQLRAQRCILSGSWVTITSSMAKNPIGTVTKVTKPGTSPKKKVQSCVSRFWKSSFDLRSLWR
eukprot:4543890-Amphidinium_carterae.1